MVSPEIIKQIQRMSSFSPRREICGVVTAEGRIIPVVNISKDPNNFVMEKYEYIRVMNSQSVEVIYHSHLHNVEPSAEDIAACRKVKLPYLIVTPTDYYWLEP